MFTNPFELPEIQLVLGTFLDKKDLVICIPVCKSWSHTFKPLLYSKLDLTGRNKSRTPSFDLCCVYARHVLDIDMDHETSPLLLALRFSNLSALECDVTYMRSDLLDDFLRRHHISLFVLSLYSSSHLRLIIWETLADTSLFPVLREFSLMGLDDDPINLLDECAAAFWKACARFKTLVLFDIYITPPKMDCRLTFNNLESLELQSVTSLTVAEYMTWFKNCPRLRRLSWALDKNDIESDAANEDYDRQRLLMNNRILEDMAQLALRGYLQSLQILELYLHNDVKNDESVPITRSVVKLLAALKSPLRELELHCGQDLVTATFLPEIQRHFSFLTSLDVSVLPADSSHMVQTIMTSSPLLWHFSGNKVQALDMMRGEPWVCLGLGRLYLTIELDPEMEDQPGMTMDDQQLFALRQISRLTRMNTINFTGTISCRERESARENPNGSRLERHEHQHNLDLRLSKGLGFLGVLSELQWIMLPSGQEW
ncbi:hypothetical protein BGX30_006646, partial [Mortierella sp. GBA39]